MKMSWGDPRKLLDALFERIRQGQVEDITLFSTIKLFESDWITFFQLILTSPTPIKTLHTSGHAIKGKAIVAFQDFLLETTSLESLAVLPRAAADEDLLPLLSLTRNLTPRLHQLDLSSKSIHGHAPNLVRLLSNLPTLRTLNVSGNLGLQAHGFTTPLSLHSLDLSDCNLSSTSLHTWIQACPNLTSLNVSKNPDLNDAFLQSSPNLPNLSLLVLQNTGISEKGLNSIVSLFPSLSLLDISQCSHLVWSKPILNAPTFINTLILNQLPCCDGFLEHDLRYFQHLKKLDMTQCKYDACKALSQCLEQLPLEHLIFRNNLFSSFQIDSTSPVSVSCKRLDLTATDLTLDQLEILLQKYISITTWEVAANPLCKDPDAIQDLIDRYSEIEIIWR